MQKNNPNTFSEKELNNLLNRSFLESHLSKTKHEKITETIASHALGVKPVSLSTRQSFIKKLTGTISLQVFITCSLLIGGGIAGIIFLNNHPEEPAKTNVVRPAAYQQTVETSNSKNEQEQKSNAGKDNAPISGKVISGKTSIANTFSLQITNQDSTTVSLAIQKPEPIYFEDPALLLAKRRDSISENTKAMDTKSLKNDTTKKRRKAKGKEHDFEYSIDNLK